MSNPERIIRTCVLAAILMSLPAVSCADSRWGPTVNLALVNAGDGYGRLLPAEERSFFEFVGSALEGAEPANPCESRVLQVCFTHPVISYPVDLPDGVWVMGCDDSTVTDRRFVRKRSETGWEHRSRDSTGLLQASVLARQRSEKVKSLVGELTATAETIHESNGKVEYRLLSIRVVGEYDAKAKKWRQVSKEIRPIGEEGP